ncbi:MAG: C2H2-type zinc finger protein [Desulfurococcaceae archaeon]
MTRLDRILDRIITRLLVVDTEVRWILAVAKCIDVDKLMTYWCPFCNRKFKTRRSLSYHLQAHPDEIVKTIECATEVLKKWMKT